MKIAILSGIVFFALSTHANAQQGRPEGGPPSAKEIIKKLDKDGDGAISKAEVKGRLAKDFDKIDTDKDGMLTLKELEAAPKPERGQGPPRQ